MLNDLFLALRSEWSGLLSLFPRLLLATAVLLVSWLAGRFVSAMLDRALSRSRFNATHRNFFRRLAHWAVLLLGLSIVLDLLGLGGVAAGLLAGGGLTAVVVGFAFRGIGENLLAGVFLAFSRPFELDDLIESGNYKGQVKAIDLRSTHIRTADGRDVFVPNAQIFNEPLVNYTRDDLLRSSFTIGIDYRDEVGQARELLQDTIEKTVGVLPSPRPACSLVDLAEQWVVLECTFWVETSDPESSVRKVRDAVLGRARDVLITEGFTLSADVSSNLAVALTERERS